MRDEKIIYKIIKIINGLIVYIVKIDSEDKYKIGYTKRELNTRIKELQTGCPYTISPIWSFKSEYPTKLESYLHRNYSHKRVEGEWFVLDNNDIEKIKEDCISFEKRIEILMENENPFILKEFNR